MGTVLKMVGPLATTQVASFPQLPLTRSARVSHVIVAKSMSYACNHTAASSDRLSAARTTHIWSGRFKAAKYKFMENTQLSISAASSLAPLNALGMSALACSRVVPGNAAPAATLTSWDCTLAPVATCYYTRVRA